MAKRFPFRVAIAGLTAVAVATAPVTTPNTAVLSAAVAQAQENVTVAGPAEVAYKTSAEFTATVPNAAGGTVQFYLDGIEVGDPANIGTDGTATADIRPVSYTNDTFKHTVTARYIDKDGYNPVEDGKREFSTPVPIKDLKNAINGKITGSQNYELASTWGVIATSEIKAGSKSQAELDDLKSNYQDPRLTLKEGDQYYISSGMTSAGYRVYETGINPAGNSQFVEAKELTGSAYEIISIGQEDGTNEMTRTDITGLNRGYWGAVDPGYTSLGTNPAVNPGFRGQQRVSGGYKTSEGAPFRVEYLFTAPKEPGIYVPQWASYKYATGTIHSLVRLDDAAFKIDPIEIGARKEKPNEPGDGDNATDPNQPGDGDTPTDPNQPGDGNTPTDPNQPGDGNTPTDPNQPGDGNTPTDPNQPGDDDTPTDPNQPGGDDNQSEPVKPQALNVPVSAVKAGATVPLIFKVAPNQKFNVYVDGVKVGENITADDKGEAQFSVKAGVKAGVKNSIVQIALIEGNVEGEKIDVAEIKVESDQNVPAGRVVYDKAPALNQETTFTAHVKAGTKGKVRFIIKDSQGNEILAADKRDVEINNDKAEVKVAFTKAGTYSIETQIVPADGKDPYENTTSATFNVEVTNGTAPKAPLTDDCKKQIGIGVGIGLTGLIIAGLSQMRIPNLQQKIIDLQKQMGIFNPQLAAAAERAVPVAGGLIGLVLTGLSIGNTIDKCVPGAGSSRQSETGEGQTA